MTLGEADDWDRGRDRGEIWDASPLADCERGDELCDPCWEARRALEGVGALEATGVVD